MKNQKGITLIALVVTIIVLLILAGVAIAMLTGDNSILDNAQKSSSNNAYSGANDQVRLAYMAVRTEIMARKVADSTYDPVADANLQELKNMVDNEIKASGFTVSCGKIESTSTKPTNASSDYYIAITYTDNNLMKGSFNETENKEEPNQDTYVYYAIEVVGKETGESSQTARLYSNLGSALEVDGKGRATTTPAANTDPQTPSGGSGN